MRNKNYHPDIKAPLNNYKIIENYRISIVIPCYGRPSRTRRIIENVLSQSINNWEAFIIGDGCPHFQNMIENGEVDDYIRRSEENGSKLHCFNLSKNFGGFGYEIINYAVQNAKGRYFIFGANDDTILPIHFEHYLSEIENTELDLVYYQTYIAPIRNIRNPCLKQDYIGHSEIIFRTDIARDYLHTNTYGHDWLLIEHIMNKSDKIKKSESTLYTYIVNHVPNQPILDNLD